MKNLHCQDTAIIIVMILINLHLNIELMILCETKYTCMCICFPSIAPMQCGNCHCFSNSIEIFNQSASFKGYGNTFSLRQLQRASHVPVIIFAVVVNPTKYWYDIDDIQSPVAKNLQTNYYYNTVLIIVMKLSTISKNFYRKVIANRAGAEIGSLITFCFDIFGPTRYKSCSNCTAVIRI